MNEPLTVLVDEISEVAYLEGCVRIQELDGKVVVVKNPDREAIVNGYAMQLYGVDWSHSELVGVGKTREQNGLPYVTIEKLIKLTNK